MVPIPPRKKQGPKHNVAPPCVAEMKAREVQAAVEAKLVKLKEKAEAAKAADEKPDAECVICLDAKPCMVCIPCGHLATCKKCAPKLTSDCPICRKELTAKPMEIFF